MWSFRYARRETKVLPSAAYVQVFYALDDAAKLHWHIKVGDDFNALGDWAQHNANVMRAMGHAPCVTYYAAVDSAFLDSADYNVLRKVGRSVAPTEKECELAVEAHARVAAELDRLGYYAEPVDSEANGMLLGYTRDDA